MKLKDQDSKSLIQSIHSSLAEKISCCSKDVSAKTGDDKDLETVDNTLPKKVVKLPPGCHLFFPEKN